MLTVQDVDFVIDVCQRSYDGDAEARALIPKIDERLDALGVPTVEELLARLLSPDRDPSRS